MTHTQAWSVEVLTEDTAEIHHVAIGYLANVATGTTTLKGQGTWQNPSGTFESEDSVVVQATIRPKDLEKGETPRDIAKGAAKAVKQESEQDSVMWQVTPTQVGFE